MENRSSKWQPSGLSQHVQEHFFHYVGGVFMVSLLLLIGSLIAGKKFPAGAVNPCAVSCAVTFDVTALTGFVVIDNDVNKLFEIPKVNSFDLTPGVHTFTYPLPDPFRAKTSGPANDYQFTLNADGSVTCPPENGFDCSVNQKLKVTGIPITFDTGKLNDPLCPLCQAISRLAIDGFTFFTSKKVQTINLLPTEGKNQYLFSYPVNIDYYGFGVKNNGDVICGDLSSFATCVGSTVTVNKKPESLLKVNMVQPCDQIGKAAFTGLQGVQEGIYKALKQNTGNATGTESISRPCGGAKTVGQVRSDSGAILKNPLDLLINDGLYQPYNLTAEIQTFSIVTSSDPNVTVKIETFSVATSSNNYPSAGDVVTFSIASSSQPYLTMFTSYDIATSSLPSVLTAEIQTFSIVRSSDPNVTVKIETFSVATSSNNYPSAGDVVTFSIASSSQPYLTTFISYNIATSSLPAVYETFQMNPLQTGGATYDQVIATSGSLDLHFRGVNGLSDLSLKLDATISSDTLAKIVSNVVTSYPAIVSAGDAMTVTQTGGTLTETLKSGGTVVSTGTFDPNASGSAALFHQGVNAFVRGATVPATGVNKPGTTTLAGAVVKAFATSNSCVTNHSGDYEGMNASCRPATTCVTGSDGKCTLYTAPGSYRILVASSQFPGLLAKDASVATVTADTFENKNYMFIKNPDGSSVGGNSTKKIGSELWIYEPVSVLWDSTQAYYPFVFESNADWSVNVCVNPPVGYKVADGSPCVQSGVANESKSILFTVVEVGSVPTKTGVDMKLKDPHGGTQTHSDSIDVRLSPGLAKKKGIKIDKFGRVQ